MDQVSKVRNVKRSAQREIAYRVFRFVFGAIITILMWMIPVIGWLLAIGSGVLTLWKTFGFRETKLVGDCPACTKTLEILAKEDVIVCPACHSCIAIREDQLVITKTG